MMVSRKREGARRILLLHVGGRWGRWASGRGEGAKDDTTINHQRGRGSMVHLFVYLLLYQMHARSINPTNQPNILPSPNPSYLCHPLSLLTSTSSIVSKVSTSLPNLHGPVRKRTMYAISTLPSLVLVSNITIMQQYEH